MDFKISCMVAPAVSLIALVLMDKMPDKYTLEDPYFNRQRWTLQNTYVVLIPSIALARVVYPPLDMSVYALAGLSLVGGIVLVTATCALYYFLIHKPYNVDKRVFGLEKSAFLSKGVLTANIVIPIALLAFHAAGQAQTMRPFPAPCPVPEAAMALASSLLDFFVLMPLRQLVFTGVLYPPVARNIGKLRAMLVLSFIQCLIFVGPSLSAALEDILLSTFATFLFSLMWYGLYVRTRSLYPPCNSSNGLRMVVYKAGSLLLLGVSS